VSHLSEVNELQELREALQKEIQNRHLIEAELRRKTVELERSNRELAQFAYVAAHDLQQPLRDVARFSQLLAQRHTGDDEEGDRWVGLVVGGAVKMQMLLDDLLVFYNVGTSRLGNRRSQLQPVELDGVVDAALAHFSGAIQARGVVVEREPLPKAMADAQQLTDLVRRLIDNALKFNTSEPPVLRIESVRKGEKIHLCIVDNGIGMDMKYAAKIFMIFQRLNPREKFEGSGIGLAIARKIVERHNGKIWVNSGRDEGCTVAFSLDPA
jgi:light-regulated signal transduction histidine kinase (bacteriophytochrome)